MPPRTLLGVPAESLALGGASAGGALTAGAVMPGCATRASRCPPVWSSSTRCVHPNGPDASDVLDPSSPHGQLSLNFAGSTEALTDPQVFAGLGDGHGFPPTLIVVCERDDLRPSGEAFAASLDDAGVDVVLRVEADAGHGHIDQPGDAAARAHDRGRGRAGSPASTTASDDD